MYYVSSFLHLIRIWGILYYMVVTQSIPLVWRPGFLFLIVMLTINFFHIFLHFLQKFVYSWSIQILFSAKKKLSGLFWVKYRCRLLSCISVGEREWASHLWPEIEPKASWHHMKLNATCLKSSYMISCIYQKRQPPDFDPTHKSLCCEPGLRNFTHYNALQTMEIIKHESNRD